jgi:hypothetical protein
MGIGLATAQQPAHLVWGDGFPGGTLAPAMGKPHEHHGQQQEPQDLAGL